MGDRLLFKVECIHTLETPESKPLKVSALNFFRPTAPPLPTSWFLYIVTQPPEGKDGVRRNIRSAWHWME